MQVKYIFFNTLKIGKAGIIKRFFYIENFKDMEQWYNISAKLLNNLADNLQTVIIISILLSW